MKLATPQNPVRSDWLSDQGYRLDSSPYLSGAYEARKLIERLPATEALCELVRTPNGIFHAGRSARRWVTDPKYGVPFFSSTDILEADSSFLPLIAKIAVDGNPRLLVERDWTLITRSGTVGRMTYTRPDMHGYSCSEHVMRVVADPQRIKPGYLHAFLSSALGIPMIVNAAYGAIIQHIEPEHIANLPVPRFGKSVEQGVHDHIQAAADLRTKFQEGVTAATSDLFESAGIPELIDFQWHREPRATGFEVIGAGPASLRAMNYDHRARRLADTVASVPHRTLGEICAGGRLSSGARFKRIEANPGFGALLVGQKDGFWVRPEGRWISTSEAPVGIFAEDETIMIASQGLPGETSLIGRAVFVTGCWLNFAYTQHFLRVVSGDSDFPGAYLFAFLRSDVAFRCLRSMLVGTGPQDIHPKLRAELPVPECTPADRERIAETVRQAYRWRDEADRLEDRAQELLENAVRGAVGADLRHDGDLTPAPLGEGAHGSGDG